LVGGAKAALEARLSVWVGGGRGFAKAHQLGGGADVKRWRTDAGLAMLLKFNLGGLAFFLASM